MIRQFSPKTLLLVSITLMIPAQIIGNHVIKKSYSGPDLILYNANIITMDDQISSANAVAIEGNLILAVETNDDVLTLQTTNTQLIDLQGRTVVPGLIEAHNHRLLNAFWDDGPEGLVRATQDMAADGYTTTHELYGDPGFISTAQTLAQEGRLAVRIDCYIPYNTNCGDNVEAWMTYPYTEKKDTTLRVVGAKIFADGGSCGASALTTLWQAGPAAGTHGDLFKTQIEMNAIVDEVLNAGYPIAMHALGDSAVVVGLNAFEDAFAGGGNTLRCRMEHLRVMREDLADQMTALGIAASIQYTWARAITAATYESYYLPQVLEWVFPWRRMADRGIPIVGGNDYPYTARSQAMQTISILATRKMQRDEVLPDWMDSDLLTVEEGLRAMTVTNAWVVFEEDVKGTITPGKLADLTVLSDDPLSMDPFDVRDITIEMTIMDGIIRHNQIGISHTAIHDAGTFSVGIDDRGLWGPFRSQVGFLYDGIDQLYHGSVLISFDSSTISTATEPQYDYVTSPDGFMDFLEPGINAAEEATVVYEDAADWHPAKIRITQKTFMWPDDPLLLVKYTFKNIDENSISNIYFGQHMDFEIEGYDNDMGSWVQNQGLDFAYMYDAIDPNTPYIGVAMFDSTGNFTNTSLTFNIAMRLNSANEEMFSQAMRSGIIESETLTLGDYAILIASGPFSLESNQSISPFMLAFVAGENLDDLKNAVNQAYQRSTLVTLVEEGPGQVPNDFQLFQNYPNPFNPITTINYGLPEDSIVQIRIYDLNGRQITELVNDTQSAGTYHVNWDASNQSSGVYLVKMIAGDFHFVQKVMLVK